MVFTLLKDSNGATGEAFFKLAKTVALLIVNQKKMLSTVVDAMGVTGQTNLSTYAAIAAGNDKLNTAGGPDVPSDASYNPYAKVNTAFSSAG